MIRTRKQNPKATGTSPIEEEQAPLVPPPSSTTTTTSSKQIHGSSRHRFLLQAALLPLLLLPLVYFCIDPRFENQRPLPGETSYPSLTAKQAAQQNAAFIRNSSHVFVLTGPYRGIGQETARALHAQGGQLVLGGRNTEKLEALMEELKKKSSSSATLLEAYRLDLADLASVQAFCQKTMAKFQDKRLILINNAATIGPAAVTAQGLERQMGVNVVGHFLLNKLLLPITDRQVWVSSTGHTLNGSPRLDLDYYAHFDLDKDKYDIWAAYQQSKLGDILLAQEFHRRYSDLQTASLHPGVIWTHLGDNIYGNSSWWGPIWDSLQELPWLIGTEGWWFVKTPAQGAATTVTVATMPPTLLTSGAYYKDSAVHIPSQAAQNKQDAKALFDWCEQVTKEYQWHEAG